jgi:hypothetical protein
MTVAWLKRTSILPLTPAGYLFLDIHNARTEPRGGQYHHAGGRVTAFQKQDGASMLRFEICYSKAFGALALGRPSKLVL